MKGLHCSCPGMGALPAYLILAWRNTLLQVCQCSENDFNNYTNNTAWLFSLLLCSFL